jgi:integration host factor subunit beta
MATITKYELIDQIAEATGQKRSHVKTAVQGFLDQVVVQIGRGNRLEFRDFGIFEVKQRGARAAHNPRTLEPVEVPPHRTVKFRAGRLMREVLDTESPAEQETEADPPSSDADAAE